MLSFDSSLRFVSTRVSHWGFAVYPIIPDRSSQAPSDWMRVCEVPEARLGHLRIGTWLCASGHRRDVLSHVLWSGLSAAMTPLSLHLAACLQLSAVPHNSSLCLCRVSRCVDRLHWEVMNKASALSLVQQLHQQLSESSLSWSCWWGGCCKCSRFVFLF